MAELLPNKIDCKCYEGLWAFSWNCFEDSKAPTYKYHPVLETEWLYVMQLIEKSLSTREKAKYAFELLISVFPGWNTHLKELNQNEMSALGYFDYSSATFDERAAAMCKVKGIKI